MVRLVLATGTGIGSCCVGDADACRYVYISVLSMLSIRSRCVVFAVNADLSVPKQGLATSKFIQDIGNYSTCSKVLWKHALLSDAAVNA